MKSHGPTSQAPQDALDPAVHAAYEKRRRLRRLSVLGFVAMWLIAMLSSFAGGQKVPEWVAALWMLGMMALLLVAAFSWRCPRCGYFIAGRFSQANYCWKCGVRLS